jgi:hypothetical protein
MEINTYAPWFKIAGLVAVTCIYLADVSFPRDAVLWNLACICIILF